MIGTDSDRRVSRHPVPRLRLAALLLLLVGACVPVAPVVQGKVVSADARTMRVQDERRPGDPPIVIDLTRADIGGTPVAGETVRVVYRDDRGVHRALAVMSVSRQQRMETANR